ncbi:MAG: rane protein [Polaromonas sp.]|nr:rane protein [Polaromonas sp.]
MDLTHMNNFFAGAIALASLIAGLFFFRFWWTTRDRFFVFFALSFWLEAVNRTYLGLAGEMREDFPVYYLIRLLSYGLILIAICDKNRPSRRARQRKGEW